MKRSEIREAARAQAQVAYEAAVKAERAAARSKAVSVFAAYEVNFDGLPRRIASYERTGNGETHHARLMRAVLELFEEAT